VLFSFRKANNARTEPQGGDVVLNIWSPRILG
jgi:hypothetical protein